MNIKLELRDFKSLARLLFGLFCATSVFAQEAASTSEGKGWGWSHWGVFGLRPRLAGSMIYDDNINISRTNEQQDVVWTITPGISIIAGDPLTPMSKLLTLDYDPSFYLFRDNDQYNSIDQSARFNAVWPISKLTLGANAGYNSLSTPMVDVGARVDRRIYDAALTSHYQISEKTSVQVNGRHQTVDYNGRLVGYKEWANENWLNYQIVPKLKLGAGVSFGFMEVDRSPEQTYQRVSVRGIYILTYKLNVNASVGGERRQYEGVSEVSVRPVFSIGSTYRPRDGTLIKLDAYRRDQSSPSTPALNYITTGISANFSQRIWKNIYGNVGGAYEIQDYVAIFQNLRATRQDNYFLIRLGLDATFTEHWTGGVFVQHRASDSNSRSGVIFDNNQIGLQTVYKF